MVIVTFIYTISDDNIEGGKLKKLLILFGIAVLLLSIWLSGCQSQGFGVHRISEEPTNYVNLTEDQMNNFPHLKEAILTNKYVETPQDEMNRLRGILEYFNTDYICYQNEYYDVGFWSAD